MCMNSDENLASLGFGGLCPVARAHLRKSNSERLDAIVEMRVRAALTAAQYEYYDSLFKNNDAAGAFAYLEVVLPDYSEIVEAETGRLERALLEEAPAIIAIEMALADVRDKYERQFSAIEGCGRREPPLAA
jgi:hypothetical protein